MCLFPLKNLWANALIPLQCRWDFFFRVSFPMSEKIWALTKGLPTFMTLVGFFPSVCSSMLNQDGTPAESLCTHITRIRLFPAVDSLVEYEGWALTEDFATFITLVLFFSKRVSPSSFKVAILFTGSSICATLGSVQMKGVGNSGMQFYTWRSLLCWSWIHICSFRVFSWNNTQKSNVTVLCSERKKGK